MLPFHGLFVAMTGGDGSRRTSGRPCINRLLAGEADPEMTNIEG
jgi:hypothetical protein